MLGRKSTIRNVPFTARMFLMPVFIATLTPALFAQWKEQGPGPIINGQDIGLTNPNNPVSGAVNAIATVPGNANTVYVGTVNGGIWKTTNATAATPTWTPLTDTQLPALSIRSLAISPLDSKLIFAGTGSSSSDANLGSPGFGVAKSIDGGTKWTVESAKTFTGTKIVSIVPGSTKGLVLAAVHNQNPFGVFRSTDDAKTFNRITGNGASGLPGCGVSNIAADPTAPNRFYAAVPPDFCLANQTPGVYKSEDDGVTWTAVNSGLDV